MNTLRQIIIRALHPQYQSINPLIAYEMAIDEYLDNTPKDQKFTYMRLYSDGTHKRFMVDHDELKDFIMYDKQWRFGCAIVVDDVCISTGYLKPKEIKKHIERIKKIYYNE